MVGTGWDNRTMVGRHENEIVASNTCYMETVDKRLVDFKMG